MDCYSSKIIAYKISRSPNLDVTIQPLEQAFERHRNDLNQLIVHSDRGFYYQHSSWRNTITEFGATTSMLHKGNCSDNPPKKNFFGILKQEMLHGGAFETYEALEIVVYEYIRCYNRDRIKLKLKGMSPEKSEKRTL